VELYLQFPIRFHGIAINYLSTGTTLPRRFIRLPTQQSKHDDQVISLLLPGKGYSTSSYATAGTDFQVFSADIPQLK
jgi:hypothetical protein